jgi:ribonuclease BN (tRNA processing enzyme)
MRVTVIGASGSFASVDSPASCYLAEAQDGSGRVWRVLLDLGYGAFGPLQGLIDPHDVDAVLLTHLHPDHFVDLCGLYVALAYDPDREPARRVPVFGPSGTIERTAAVCGDSELGKLEAVFDVRSWQDTVPVVFGPLEITPFRVRHPVDSYGLRVRQIEAGGDERFGGTSVLAYTGDTDSCPALVPLAQGADLFLAEASFQEDRESVRGVHLTGLRAGRVAAEAGVLRLMLTHLPPWTNPAVVGAEARSVFTGPVEFARPGAVHLL